MISRQFDSDKGLVVERYLMPINKDVVVDIKAKVKMIGCPDNLEIMVNGVVKCLRIAYGHCEPVYRYESYTLQHVVALDIKSDINKSQTQINIIMSDADIYLSTHPLDIFDEWIEDICNTVDQDLHKVFPLISKKTMVSTSISPHDYDMQITQSSFQYLMNMNRIDPIRKEIRARWDMKTAEDKDFEAKLIEFKSKKKSTPKNVDGYNDSLDLIKTIFPQLNMHVDYPCGCTTEKGNQKNDRLSDCIIHLNDAGKHGKIDFECDEDGEIMGIKIDRRVEKQWTREEIADWLESLDINLEMREENANDNS